MPDTLKFPSVKAAAMRYVFVSIPFYSYLGGLFVVFYLLGMTWIAPKFGVGNAVAFVLLGQIISIFI